jgi:hypothetical protein
LPPNLFNRPLEGGDPQSFFHSSHCCIERRSSKTSSELVWDSEGEEIPIVRRMVGDIEGKLKLRVEAECRSSQRKSQGANGESPELTRHPVRRWSEATP